jgi:ABC-type multidrug transport system fused ATPase/permease subunit
MFDLRGQIFGKLQRLPLAYYDRNPVGRTMTRVTSDVEVLNELFSSGVVAIFGDIFTLLLIVTAMFIMDWQLALVTMAVMPFVFASPCCSAPASGQAYRDVRVKLADQRIPAGAHLRRDRGPAVRPGAGRVRAVPRDQRRVPPAHLRSIKYYALFFPIIEVLTAIALAVIITYGGFQSMTGAVSVGTMAAFLQLARRFFRPIQDLSEKYNMLQGAMASSERIFALLDTPSAHQADAQAPARLPRRPVAARSSSATCGSPMAGSTTTPAPTGTGCSATSASASGRGSASRRRPHGCRQDIADQPAAAVLRAAAWRDPAGRRADPRRSRGRTTGPIRPRAAGRLPVQPHHGHTTCGWAGRH